MRKDLGDFQTPLELVELVLEVLNDSGQNWGRVLEPTCGSGNFIEGILRSGYMPDEILGFDIQESYIQECQRLKKLDTNNVVNVRREDFFQLNLRELDWKSGGDLLVIGNPPWVTNSELGSLGSDNSPRKHNLKGLKGLDALTGSSNFDIAEAIIIKLLRDLERENPTVAMLVKTSVARNILEYASQQGLPIESCSIYRIDAKKWFNASADACLFCVKLGQDRFNYSAKVYDSLENAQVETTIGVVNGKMVANLQAYENSRMIDGKCQFNWRQGLKHDLSKVMELSRTEGDLYNGFGVRATIEDNFVYPLLKSSDLSNGGSPRFSVIVTQKKIGEDTLYLEHSAPKLWEYLTQYKDLFDNRKSSIYRGKPPFSIFGVGEYSLAMYKVAISGMYKTPRFRVLGPLDGKPVMLDDTCYFIPCESAEQACLLGSLLNSTISMDFINSTTFWDSKRPVTKKLLQRIDIRALLEAVDKERLLESANQCLIELGVPAIDEQSNLEKLVFGDQMQSKIPFQQ